MATGFKRGLFIPRFISPFYFGTIYLEMKVTQEEMAEAKVPINLRDYCAHLFIPLMECRKENYYLPWKCKKEKHAWDDCEFQE